MIPVDVARDRILNALCPTATHRLDYTHALGRVLAAPLMAARTQPPFDASAMDGYAVRSADLATPDNRFGLQGESAAGHGFRPDLEPGSAIRISTGAPIPAGADQVVIQENAERDGDSLVLHAEPKPGANIRHAGIDFFQGDTLVPAGVRVNPDMIALAVGAGQVELTVHRQPRIGIVSTGDELVEPGESTGPDQIINSVSKGLSALIEAADCEPVYLGIARDTPQSVRERFADAAGLDLVVTIGGASVGDHDHLRHVFAEDGGVLAFEKIALKPGKPTWFGTLSGTPVLGLPGNPVSALVVARLLLLPAVARLNGQNKPPVFSHAICAVDLPGNDHRETYLRGQINGDGRVQPLNNQDSSALSALVRATCLIRRPIHADAIAPGDSVEILPLLNRD